MQLLTLFLLCRHTHFLIYISISFNIRFSSIFLDDFLLGFLNKHSLMTIFLRVILRIFEYIHQYIERWAKKDPFTEIAKTLFQMIKIILDFTNTYWDISMWLINSQYRSICQPPTWITCWSLGLNASMHLSMISGGILFHSSIIAPFKESRWVIRRSQYTHFAPGVPRSQIYWIQIWNVRWPVMGFQ